MHGAPFGTDFSRSPVVGIGGFHVDIQPQSTCPLMILGMASICVPESVLLASSHSQLDGLQINNAITTLQEVCAWQSYSTSS